MRVTYFNRQRGSKYNNKTCHCHNGHIHDSILEADYCDQLEMLLKNGDIKHIERQVTYALDVAGVHICNHIVDFLVTTNDGVDEVHEVKGFATDVWHIKYKLFRAIFPELKYHVIAAGNYQTNSFQRSKRTRAIKRIF